MNKAKLLTDYLTDHRAVPFDWQTANCLHFAGKFVALVEQRDPLAGRKMPATLAAARRIQRQGGDLAALITAALDRDPIAPAFAQIGDVVLLPLNPADPEALACGICWGEYAACVTDGGAIMLVAMTPTTHAWRVGA